MTQYYILERRLESELFDADLGYGYTYNIVAGPTVFALKNWKYGAEPSIKSLFLVTLTNSMFITRLVGSFYAFDRQLPCSNKYTVFTRDVSDLEAAENCSYDLDMTAQ